jgi:hypothetical protein
MRAGNLQSKAGAGGCVAQADLGVVRVLGFLEVVNESSSSVE